MARVERAQLITGMVNGYADLLGDIQDYYSQEIVPRAAHAGMGLTHDMGLDVDALPFPVTLVNQLGGGIDRRAQGLSVSVYSDYPFPWRSDRVLTPEQREALDILAADPTRPLIREGMVSGIPVVRLARALVMKESCVPCHNGYALGHARPWTVGEFRGVREVVMPVASGPSTDRRSLALAAGLVVLAAAIGALAVWPLVTRLNRALRRSEDLARALEHAATHDPLTGLPSLGLARDRLERAIGHARRNGGKAGVMFVDLDGFKQVNDQWGHDAGDRVLIEAGTRMAASVREVDTVARIGGDEFLVVLAGLTEPQLATRAAERIVEGLSAPIDLGGPRAAIGASIGIAIFPDDADNAEDLLRRADQAMYQVKRAGKNNWLRYAAE